ncbi:flagellar hook-basal body complex protein [Campylobacter vicugnae]|uniref:flagellar hook-basal body complex protein n=1 Tax=Campylobacter vicugnae TaxID=1660076 RepID=UPI00254D1B9A|nr:flagellar hook-basal body complex protein [Campylobacter ovis]MDL0105726.1 flagellar hook-basal body complex protein [Campylobacter ovis]MDL0107254.1 flagellar hook-basal body complex protein [Campylobacter ovis]
MMGALWSGVTGLQAHQVAMDVEGNNIANVNTVGFKYSRASFADLFSQTQKVATAPQGNLGGKNSMQIGLGSTVNTVTKIFKQGTIQTTDKQSDMAIQGDGFFVVSADGGKTYMYTRNGDFSLDSQGNFVDRNGYIVQGWMRNEDTGIIDPTGPLDNIVIEPGMSMEANPTSELAIIANLNSGSNIGTKNSPIYTLDQYNDFLDINGNGLWDDGEAKNPNDLNNNTYYINSNKEVAVKEAGVDLGVVFNGAGEGLNLREGQGMWVSYADAKATFGALPANVQQRELHISLNGIEIPKTAVNSMEEVAKKINEFTNKTGIQATVINGTDLQLTNNNNQGTTDAAKNIKIRKLDGDNTSIQTTNVITAYKYTYSSAAGADAGHSYSDSAARVVKTTEDLRKAMQTDAREYVNYSGTRVSNAVNGATYFVNAVIARINENRWAAGPVNTQQDLENAIAALNNGLADAQAIFTNLQGKGVVTEPISEAAVGAMSDIITAIDNIGLDAGAQYNSANDIIEALRDLITDDKLAAMAAAEWDSPLDADGQGNFANNTANGLPGADPDNTNSNATYRDINLNDGVQVTVNEKGQFVFKNPSGDAAYGQNDGHTIVNQNQQGGTDVKDSPDAYTDAQGNKLVPSNQDTYINDYNMQIAVTGYSNIEENINENSALADVFKSLSGGLSTGTSEKVSSNLTMSSHAATTEIYDSLGSKHEIKFEWRKVSYSPENGTEWSLLIQVPEPGVLNADGAVSNVISGSARFNNDGTLLGFTPTTLTFTANNGSAPGQNIELNFGKIGDSNGLRSNDNPSATDNIVQDGYAAGNLTGTRIDESGTIIGSFSNGRSFGLAQVSLAVFTNNEGLETRGGNIFSQTANSGDPVFGAAGTSRRGTITASALEMSNVDLSRALTQLIVVQRGYQANSKTITTSDQMLTSLLQIKQ